MLKEYLVTFPTITSTFTFQYDFNTGILRGVKFEGDDYNVQHLFYLRRVFPANEEQFQIMMKNNPKWRAKLLDMNIDFDSFWNVYAYKVGNKARAKKLWDALSDANKQKALAWLPTYDQERKITGAAKLYPETYINQKRWNNG